ncbi:hypothetical protein EF906_28385, partial [Streptomyces sp. WAC08241]
VDRSTFERVAPEIPAHVVKVAESGARVGVRDEVVRAKARKPGRDRGRTGGPQRARRPRNRCPATATAPAAATPYVSGARIP